MQTYRIIILSSLLLFYGCHKQIEKWPNSVSTSIWVPDNAQKKTYDTLDGTYQLTYKAEVCFPGYDFISLLVAQMSKKGWKRLEFDFLNPEIKTNHARGGPYGIWSHFVDNSKNEDVHQWGEDWEDSSGNIIRYSLRYKTKLEDKATSQISTPKTCDLDVTAIYTPFEIRRVMEKQAVDMKAGAVSRP
jgi:hypothetical protein